MQVTGVRSLYLASGGAGMMKLEEVKAELNEVFRDPDFRVAHRHGRETLLRMAASSEILFEILRKNIHDSQFLQSRRVNPVVALPILDEANYTLVANCWIPRPDGKTSLSHQSIHHHGNLLLTTICAFGEGYESMLFRKIDPFAESGLVLEKTYRNSHGNVEFVDSYTPHVVFYPAELSITFALWSRERPRVGGRLAKYRPLLGLKVPLRKAVRLLGLGSAFSFNQENDLDFVVRNGKIVKLSQRAMYQPGDNRSFLQALHFVAKGVGFPDAAAIALLESRLGSGQPVNEFVPCHMLLPDGNLDKREILACL